jgi:hypothetical protein
LTVLVYTSVVEGFDSSDAGVHRAASCRPAVRDRRAAHPQEQYGSRSASSTQIQSHSLSQQNESYEQTELAQDEQLGGSASPALHSLCAQLLLPS